MAAKEDEKESKSNYSEEKYQLPPPPPTLMPSCKRFKTARNTFKPVEVHFAVNSEGLEELQTLIESGTDLNYIIHGNTPLTLAILKENLEVAHLLIKGGADVNLPEKTKLRRQPIHIAVQMGDLSIVRALVEHGANVQASDDMLFTPLHYACVYGRDVGIVEYLLEQDAHVNVRDDRGRTPLFRAAESGFINIIRILHEEGASVNIPDNYGWTPLHQAIICCQLDIVKELLSCGSDIRRCDVNGDTVLHASVGRLQRRNILILMATSPNYYTRHLRAVSPSVQKAVDAFGHNMSLIHVVLDSGAKVNVKNIENKTPFQLAAEEGHVTVMNILIAAGANLSTESWLLYRQWPSSIEGNEQIQNWLQEKADKFFVSLRDLCKFSIRRCLAPNINCKIPSLPLPSQLIKYLDIAS